MSLLTTLLSSKIAAGALAVGTLAAGGTAAAAATNTLPEPAQETAHQVFGAPSPVTDDAEAAAPGSEAPETEAPDDATEGSTASSSTTEAPTGTTDTTATVAAKGPDASLTSPAAKGLCTAYNHGGLHNPKSTAYKALLTAATDAGTAGADSDAVIKGYCVLVLTPVTQGTSGATSIPGASAPTTSAPTTTTSDDSNDNGSDAPKPVKSKAAKAKHQHTVSVRHSSQAGSDEQASDDNGSSQDEQAGEGDHSSQDDQGENDGNDDQGEQGSDD